MTSYHRVPESGCIFQKKGIFCHAEAKALHMLIVFETIVYIVGCSLLLLTIVISYPVLVSHVIPKVTLKPYYTARFGDRGIRRCRIPEGHAVVYAPGSRCADGIRQYVLIAMRESGQKFIKCLTDGRVSEIVYDIAVFDAENRMIDVFSVSERLEGSRWTKAFTLPQETAYVSVILRQADGVSVCTDRIYAASRIGECLCLMLTVGLTTLLAALTRALIYSIFHRINLVHAVPHISWTVTLLTAALFGFIFANALLWHNRKLTRKVMNQ